LLLTLIIRRFEHDMDSLAETLQEAGAPIVVDASAELPDGIGESLDAYNLQVQAAQNQINVARKHLRAAMALPSDIAPDAAADTTVGVNKEPAFEATEKLTPVGVAPTQPHPKT
jgi:hypothetical protein